MVGVGVKVVHPRIPKIEQEVVGVGVALKLSVSDGTELVGEAVGDWLSGVLDDVGQPIPRPRSPLQESVGVGVAESVG